MPLPLPSLIGMTDIAVLGAGRMGAAMAFRLTGAGHRVTVWNRTPARAAPFDLVAATPAAAVAGAEVVITMVSDGTALGSVLRAAAAAMTPGTILVQMSTVDPGDVLAAGARLPAGVDLLDAPVGGSVDAAAAGSLRIFAGGAAEVLARAEPVLRDLGTVTHCGPIGAGTTRKLITNTAMLTALGALRDTLAVAEALGVDRAGALAVLAGGPLEGARLRATRRGSHFPLALAAKDLALALRRAPHAPVGGGTLSLLRAAPDPAADIARLITVESP